MFTFRVSGRRLAVVVMAIALVVAAGVSFAVLSQGAHAASPGPNTCADAGAAPGCTVVYVAHYKAHSAQAQFTQTDNSSDCPTTTATYVWAGDTVQHDSTAGPSDSAEVTVQIYQADCTGNVTFDAVGSSSDVTVTAPGTNLQTASAVATVPITDYLSGTTVDVSVNLSWVGMGDVSRGIWIAHEQTPHGHLNSHQTGTARTALVTGSVVAGTTDYASGSSALGYLAMNDSGSLYITR
jgi:hypothetical protein